METESSGTPEDEVREAVKAFDQAFSEGRLADVSAVFASDALLLIHQQEAVTGRAAIEAYLGEIFEAFDTSAYEPRYGIIDVQGSRAYVLSSFDEVLRPRDGGPSIRIHGRAVHFWRRESDGAWRIVMLLTGRSAPEEPER